MFCVRQIVLLYALLALIVMVVARPDSAGHYPDLPAGISHGGIPYGSMSGNVAAYYNKPAPSSRRTANLYSAASKVDYAPIEQWL